ncbi:MULTISPECIES: hypothetical protein [unclassified Inquilinus]|uniref:hypothetical protein n=1 Tax=unclassified Inquilinus TaxID=2645927 RepID=UPI003F921980
MTAVGLFADGPQQGSRLSGPSLCGLLLATAEYRQSANRIPRKIVNRIMLDVTANEIAELNDIDLRELVGRLCEAELANRGLSPAAVTWGGNQTAADGGLDVRVALPADTAIDGFIPRPVTGFQVKKPDMSRAAIRSEMQPAGAIRPVIQELADQAGSYVIISSKDSTADIALRNRRGHCVRACKGSPTLISVIPTSTTVRGWRPGCGATLV